MISIANRPKTQTASTHSSVIFAEAEGEIVDCTLFSHYKRIDLWTCHSVWACVVTCLVSFRSVWLPAIVATLATLALAACFGFQNRFGKWALRKRSCACGKRKNWLLVSAARASSWPCANPHFRIPHTAAEAEFCQQLLLLLLLLGSNTFCRLIVCRRTWSTKPRPSHIRGSPPHGINLTLSRDCDCNYPWCSSHLIARSTTMSFDNDVRQWRLHCSNCCFENY